MRDDPSEVVRALLERSFSLIGDCVSAHGDAGVALVELQECQTMIALGAAPRDIEKVGLACLDTCRDFLATSTAGESDRQKHFTDLMDLAQDAMKRIGSKPAIAGAELAKATSGFDAVLKLTTLAEVKAAIVAELAALTHANDARRQEFNETITAYQTQVATLEAVIIRHDGDVTMDALTGLINRGAFDRTVKGLAHVPGACFSLALLDVDHLKKVNEEHGHLAGDRVLLNIALVLKSAFRENDLIARYGGDKFAILMRDATLRQSESRIHNAISAITHDRLTADDGRAVQFTISGGVADLTSADTMTSVVARAEAALDDAKTSGRNRVVAHHAQHAQHARSTFAPPRSPYSLATPQAFSARAD